MNKITLSGKIEFEPENKTKKHNEQASWKRIAMVMFDGDVAEYYAWFINKRFNLPLNKPLRGAHVSFINDSSKDISHNFTKSMEETNNLWNTVKNKWDGKIIDITFDLRPNSDTKHWWLSIPKEERYVLQGIRNELGLGEPFWQMHMSLGFANEKNIHHSVYINKLIEDGFISFEN